MSKRGESLERIYVGINVLKKNNFKQVIAIYICDKRYGLTNLNL